MKPVLKRVLKGVGAFVLIAVAGIGIYAYVQASAFDSSIERVYDVPVPALVRSTDPAVIARGEHLSRSVAGCSDCHGPDLGGGKTIEVGPLGTISAPNISMGGLGAAYSDGELARVIKHGLKKDGRSLRFMPAQEICWLPESDVIAVISYIRSLPPADRPNGPTKIGLLGKILDRRGMITFDVARHIDHDKPIQAVPPAPTAEYGALVARLCTGCHGEHLSGGRIPGAPSSFPVPLNLTPHETGMKDWNYEDFDRLLTTSVRKNGKTVDPFMPAKSFANFDETERKAVFAYLQSLPPMPFGGR